MRPTSRDQLNGSRPARLKINKESHSIQKSSVSNSSSSSSSSTATSSIIDHHRDPVIIYTHSPKIIHTEARDFMALVQKLTGLSPNPAANDNNNPAAATSKSSMMPPPAPQSNTIAFDDGYINPSSVDLQVITTTSSCNSLSLTDSSSPDPPNATTTAVGSSDNIHLLKLPDSADFFFPESPNCFMYQEMSEISNSWIQPAFGYGDHENLF